MKRVIFCFVAAIVALSIGGAFWDRSHEKEREIESYQKKLAKQNAQIEELEDSIGRLNDKVDILQATLEILRIIDSTKVEEAEQLLWNIKEDIFPRKACEDLEI